MPRRPPAPKEADPPAKEELAGRGGVPEWTPVENMVRSTPLPASPLPTVGIRGLLSWSLIQLLYINQVSERDDMQVATRKTMELLVSHASHGLVRYLVGSRASLRPPRFGGPRGPMRQCAEATFTCIGLGGRAPGTAGQRVLRP